MAMSEQISNLSTALAQAQSELLPAVKNAKNPMLHNKYADLASCYEATRAVLPKYGLAISQVCMPSEHGYITVKTILLHKSGEWLDSDVTLPCTGNKGVNEAQATGSALTYARRYGLSAIVGLVADDDDDACNACSSPRQRVETARQEARESNTNPPKDTLRKAFFAKCKEVVTGQDGIEYRDVLIAFLSKYFGRALTTSNELTEDEMRRFLDDKEL